MSRSLGNALKEARKRAGLTQSQVADRIGVTRAAVGLWESSSQVATDNLIKVCAILGIEVQSAVEGIVQPEIWQNNIHELKRRFDDVKGRLDALRPKISVAAKAAEHPAHVFAGGANQPVYIIRSSYSQRGNIQISTKPAFLVERKLNHASEGRLYLAAIGSSVLEPKISNKSFAIVSPWKLAEIGDLVLVLPPQNIGKASLDLLEAIEFQPAWMGELSSITASEIKLQQYNPWGEIVIELDLIGVMHTISAEP